jgi:hypothetical protein
LGGLSHSSTASEGEQSRRNSFGDAIPNSPRARLKGGQPQRRVAALRRSRRGVEANIRHRVSHFENPSLSEARTYFVPNDRRTLYPVHATTRKSLGDMTRKLSVTESQRSAQLRGTFSRRKSSVASAN